MTTDEGTLEDTLVFAEQYELSVIPVRFKDKKPGLDSWKPYQEHRATKEEINKWFLTGVPRNIGFICGSISGSEGRNLVVLDYDDTRLFDIIHEEKGVSTRCVKTNRGIHEYFFLPEPISKSKWEIEADGKPVSFDIQGEGSYALAPPSVHPEGAVYQWVNDLPIKFLEGETGSHFKQYLMQRVDVACKRLGWEFKGEAVEYDIKEILKGAKQGSRNHIGYVLASYYRQTGKSQEDAEELMADWNQKNIPPLPQSELAEIIKSAYKPDAKIGFIFKDLKKRKRKSIKEHTPYEGGFSQLPCVEAMLKQGVKVGVQSAIKSMCSAYVSDDVPKVDIYKAVEEFVKNCPESARLTKEEICSNVDRFVDREDLFFECSKPKKFGFCVDGCPLRGFKQGEFFLDNGKPILPKIADDIMARYRFLTMEDDPDDVYCYGPEAGVYREYGLNVIRTEAKHNFGFPLSNHMTKEVITYIQSATFVKRAEVNSKINLFHMENGIYNMDDDSFMEFSPDFYATIKLPVVYDPNATCPRFDKFLIEIFKGDEKARERQQFIRELIGYCLLRDGKFHILVIFIGEGGNGKTVLIETINSLLGKENISNTSLQSFQNNKYAVARLYGKLANTFADINSKTVGDTGLIKMLSGEDTIDAEMKYVQKPIKFTNYATMIFSTNNPPIINDDTKAWWRRFRSVTFNRLFEGENDDKDLKAKLRTESEISGIFNMGIKALRQLLERGEFTEIESAKQQRYDYLRRSNTPLAFVEERVEEDYNSYVFKDEYYALYREFCIEHHLRLESRKRVSERLPEYVNVTIQKKTGEDGNRKEAWVGIRVEGAPLRRLEPQKEPDQKTLEDGV